MVSSSTRKSRASTASNLTPEAAAVVKQKGELAIAGKGFPTAYDQCRLITPPSTFAMQLTFEMLPLKNGNIVIVYDQNMNFRYIRMNGAHPTNLVASPMGNSVGHWEGDTLVVDTVGIQTVGRTSHKSRIPGHRTARRERSQQCEEQYEACCEAHQSLQSSTFNSSPHLSGDAGFRFITSDNSESRIDHRTEKPVW
jgi:hypothetical protein